MDSSEDGDNFEAFKDCLSVSIVAKLSSSNTNKSKKRPARRRKNSRSNDGIESSVSTATEVASLSDLSEFVDYLADETFASLPEDLRCISYASVNDHEAIAERYEPPISTTVQSELMGTLPPSVSDSLYSYGIIDEPSDLERFLEPVINSYITSTIAPPPEYTPSLTSSRPAGCEICEREHLPLTYHHLIPRQAHGKAVKRGWHKDWELNKVAWLCRACHSFVHKCASNDDLAKDYYDVELLLEREDVQRFAAWVGKVRWKAR